MTMPGVQKPHWLAPLSTNALAQPRRVSGGRPSNVSTARPAKRVAGWAHETTGRPSTMTVHAPHEPSGAQPSFIERSPHASRSSSSRLDPSGTATSTTRPLSVSCMGRPLHRFEGPGGPFAAPGPLSTLALSAHAQTVPFGPTCRSVGTQGLKRTPEEHVERPGLATEVVDKEVYARAVGRFREQRIVMPTFATLADPNGIPASAVGDADPDAADPRNLFRVHWHNADDRRGRLDAPAHVVLPKALTGVEAPIVVALADRFPMIASHKVLAAYACLAPRIVTGQFDPTSQRAVWPSTGNYCRGGVAISRIMGCRGVAVLPEGMSGERFEWLARWVADPADIIRTPGTESNVKEI